jgi:hypothetical protein
LLRSSTSRIDAAPRAGQLSVARRDYFLLAVGIVALLLLTGLPHLYAGLTSPADRRYMGIVSDVPDTAQYFSWLRAHQQSMIVSNMMTPEPNQPAFFNLLWFVLGRLTLWTGMSMAAAFQLLRLVAGAAFGVALFWLFGLLAEDRRERWLATALVLVGGGLGWIWAVEKYLSRRGDLLYPLDAQVAEPNAFLSLIGYPHFLLAAALVLAIFGLFLVGERAGQTRYHALAAGLALTLGLQHAYDLITIYLVLGVYLLLRWWNVRQFPWRGAIGLTLIGLISSPPAAYFTYLTTHDPIWRRVLAQFANAGVYTPNPLHLLIVLGPQLPLAAAALPGLWRRRTDADLLLLTWAVVGFGLLYIPTDFQIHMLNPYQVPLAILAVRTARRIAMAPGGILTNGRAGARLQRWAPVALLLVAIPINIYLLGWRFVDLGRHRAPYFLHREEVAALEWLDHQGGDAIVLSGETLGQYVPALSGKRAVLAHWAQTVDYFTKRDEVARFFDPATSDAERVAVLQRYNVAYVLAGEHELRAGARTALDHAALEKVFDTDGAVVYRIR